MQAQETAKKQIDNLNSLLRGEISAVETYDQAITHLSKNGDRIDDLMANRECHSKRVSVLDDEVRKLGAIPESSSGMWGSFAKLVEKSASVISSKTVIAAMEDGEDHGLEEYRNPDKDTDVLTLRIIKGTLLPAQMETHARMSRRQALEK